MVIARCPLADTPIFKPMKAICITSEVKLKAKFMLTRIRKGPVVDTLKVIWCTKQLKSADS